MFINYDVNTGLSINFFRKAGSYAGDVADVVIAMQNGNECVCCELDGAMYALEDGAYWQGSDATQETIEELHHFIMQFENEYGITHNISKSNYKEIGE